MDDWSYGANDPKYWTAILEHVVLLLETIREEINLPPEKRLCAYNALLDISIENYKTIIRAAQDGHEVA